MFPTTDEEASPAHKNVNKTKEESERVVYVAIESATFFDPSISYCVSRRTFQGCVAVGWGWSYGGRNPHHRARSLKRYSQRSATKRTTPTTTTKKKRKKKRRRRRRRSSLPRPE